MREFPRYAGLTTPNSIPPDLTSWCFNPPLRTFFLCTAFVDARPFEKAQLPKGQGRDHTLHA